MHVTIRPACDSDAANVAEVYLASRRAFVAFAPFAHSDSDVRGWIANVLLPSGGVWVTVQGEDIVGMMALAREEGVGWIEQLYLAPSAVGQGIGSRLVERAKSELGAPLHLYTFQANTNARRFYERHGFAAVAFSDGRDNEEKCPDVLYEWTGE